METLSQIRIVSYLSLIFAGAMSADGGYRVMGLVLFCFVAFHLIGKLTIAPANQTPQNVSRSRAVICSVLVISGPWIGVFLALLWL